MYLSEKLQVPVEQLEEEKEHIKKMVSEAIQKSVDKKSEDVEIPEKESRSGDRSENEVKRLKQYLSICGIRRRWNLEMKDMSSSQQIKYLKSILDETGLTGRLSVKACKEYRKKKELEEEIKEVLNPNLMLASRTRSGLKKNERLARKPKREESEIQSDLDESDNN